jgi:hypothetical protein
MRPGQELFDLAADRDCVTNLATKRATEVAALRTQMWAELKAQGGLRAIGRGAEYEAHPSAQISKRTISTNATCAASCWMPAG